MAPTPSDAAEGQSGTEASPKGPSTAQPLAQPTVTVSKSASPVSSSSHVPASSSSRAAAAGSPAASEAATNIPQTEQRTPKKTMLLLIVAVAAVAFLVVIVATVIITRKGAKDPSRVKYTTAATFYPTESDTEWTETVSDESQMNISDWNTSDWTSLPPSMEMTMEPNETMTMPSGDARLYEHHPASNGSEHASNGAGEGTKTEEKLSDAAGSAQSQNPDAHVATPTVEEDASASSRTQISEASGALSPGDEPMSGGSEHASVETGAVITTDAAGNSEGQDPEAHAEAASVAEEARALSPAEILEATSALSLEDSAASPEETR